MIYLVMFGLSILAMIFLMLSIVEFYMLLKYHKSNKIWKDRYWKAQAEIYKLYELKFKQCTQQKKN